MSETDDSGRAKEAEALRWASNFLCLWRVCANAGCRRAQACRGRPYLCGKRNGGALPKGVRDFFTAFSRRSRSASPSRTSGRTWRDARRRKPSSPGARRPPRLPDGPHDAAWFETRTSSAPHPEEGRRPVSKGEARAMRSRCVTKEDRCGAKDNMHMFLLPRPRGGERSRRFGFKL
jgi:hypothetical protein